MLQNIIIVDETIETHHILYTIKLNISHSEILYKYLESFERWYSWSYLELISLLINFKCFP